MLLSPTCRTSRQGRPPAWPPRPAARCRTLAPVHHISWQQHPRACCRLASTSSSCSETAEPQPSTAPTPASLNFPIESAGLSERQLEQLHTYLDYMLEVNKVMNLTAVRDPEEAWQRHVGDSLAILPVIDRHAGLISQRPDAQSAASGSGALTARGGDDRKGSKRGAPGKRRPKPQEDPPLQPLLDRAGGAAGSPEAPGPSERVLRVIDVGTGAGLPGMVLAVARPHWRVTLLDTLRKRCDFLAQAAERAGLTNVDVVWARAEDAGRKPELREAYDLSVARAVAETRVLAELCLPFVRVGGLWVAPKGPGPQAEVDAAGPAIGKLGGKLVALDLVQSFSADGQRTCVVAAKTSSTPDKFPRKPGTPNASPL